MKSNITKLTIRAIRDCSYLTFRMSPSDHGAQVGSTTLSAVLRTDDQKNKDDPFRQDIRHEVEIDGIVSDYTKETSWGGLDTTKSYKGGTTHQNYKCDGCNPVRLLANILKDGDCLRVKWITGNSSDWAREKGLYRDSCDLAIYRPVVGAPYEEWKEIGGFRWEESVTDHYVNRVCQPVTAKIPRVDAPAVVAPMAIESAEVVTA